MYWIILMAAVGNPTLEERAMLAKVRMELTSQERAIYDEMRLANPLYHAQLARRADYKSNMQPRRQAAIKRSSRSQYRYRGSMQPTLQWPVVNFNGPMYHLVPGGRCSSGR